MDKCTCTGTHTGHLCPLQHLSGCCRSLCAPDLTCFEPEAHGHMLKGMEFHKLYMDNSQSESAEYLCSVCVCVCVCSVCGVCPYPLPWGAPRAVTVVQQQLLNPHVVMMGVSTAYIAYTRFRVLTNRWVGQGAWHTLLVWMAQTCNPCP